MSPLFGLSAMLKREICDGSFGFLYSGLRSAVPLTLNALAFVQVFVAAVAGAKRTSQVMFLGPKSLFGISDEIERGYGGRSP